MHTTNMCLMSGLLATERAAALLPCHACSHACTSCRTIIAQWTTRDFGAPVVRWGVQPGGRPERQSNGSYSTYTQLQMCGAPRQQQRVGGPGGAQLRSHDWPAAKHPLLLLRGGPGEMRVQAHLAYLLAPVGRKPCFVGIQHLTIHANTVLQVLGFSREYSFVSSPPPGMNSMMRFLAVADLGHVTSDGSTEIDHIQARDPLDYTPVDTLEYVGVPFHIWLVLTFNTMCVKQLHIGGAG